jgi:hypothetical protein
MAPLSKARRKYVKGGNPKLITGGTCLSFFFWRSSPDFGVAILALILICSHPTVWNPKSKDFWEKHI